MAVFLLHRVHAMRLYYIVTPHCTKTIGYATCYLPLKKSGTLFFKDARFTVLPVVWLSETCLR